jgi:5'(3')-deoxyribonucleotidase
VRPRLLVDVDGVVADMVPSFVSWANLKFGLSVDPETIVYHNDMGRSPSLREVDVQLRELYPTPGQDGGWGGAFIEFMSNPRAYPEHVTVVPGSQEALAQLRETYDVLFVTALMRRANQHVPGKLDWIGQNFPGIHICTIPSELKCWIPGTFAIDDRYDTCMRWWDVGTQALLFKRPWSEVPERTPYTPYDWPAIVRQFVRAP